MVHFTLMQPPQKKIAAAFFYSEPFLMYLCLIGIAKHKSYPEETFNPDI